MYRLADIGIKVHRIYEIHLRIALGKVLDRTAHIDESLAEVLAAVSGYQHHAAAVRETCRVVTRLPQDIAQLGIERLVRLDLVDHHVQRVDDRIARDGDTAVFDSFLNQILTGGIRRCEMQRSNAPGYLPVHFFRPRRHDVVCAQSSLNMPHRYPGIKCRQSRSRRGCGVAVHKHAIWAGAFQYIPHPLENA